jgi:hypothetical protein
MPALTFKTSHMLHRGTIGFTNKLSQTRLGNPVSARDVKLRQLDGFQAINQSEHRHWLCRFRHLAHPGEPTLVGLQPALRQLIQLAPLIGGQSIVQSPMNFASRPKAGFNAEPFKYAWQWNNHAPPPAFFHHQPSQIGKPVVFNRMRQQPGQQLRGMTRAKRPKLKFVLQLKGMSLTVSFRGKIFIDGMRKGIDLPGDKCDKGRGWPLLRPQGPAWIPQIAEHERITETVLITTASLDHRKVAGRQRVMAHQLALIGWGIE